jgi:TAP-like protein
VLLTVSSATTRSWAMRWLDLPSASTASPPTHPAARHHRRPRHPYWDSLALAHDLARARLLTITGYGHTEFANPSTCATNDLVRCLLTGALPPAGTICPQNATPFGQRPGRHRSHQPPDPAGPPGHPGLAQQRQTRSLYLSSAQRTPPRRGPRCRQPPAHSWSMRRRGPLWRQARKDLGHLRPEDLAGCGRSSA